MTRRSHLVPGYVHPCHDDQQREDELQQGVGRGHPYLNVHVDSVEVGAVDHPGPGPGQEEEEVPVVEVTHAVPGEHAVVLPLEDADVAGGAVPGSGGSHSFADCAVVPVLPPQPCTGDHDVPGAGVNQPERGNMSIKSRNHQQLET